MYIEKQQLIKATDEKVYQILTDLKNYHRWNPWVIDCSDGMINEGELTEVTVKLGKKTMKVKHKIVTLKPHSRFVWCDTGWFTLFAFGQRERTIEPCEGGVNYKVILKVTGPLAFVASLLYKKDLIHGLTQETQALKQWCEKT
ncbi:MAG: SRPBCC domain-containing protein [Cellvibrionales bacterium]|nr:SRPBCC domain-containing protein [Cellvibrionales bacterium]